MSPKFRTDLVASAFGSGEWILFKPLEYVTLVTGVPYEIIVPKAFRTDLASIPKVFRNIIDVNGRHRRAATVHDWLYYTKAFGELTRAQCDAVFNEAMAVEGVPTHRRLIMYKAVRVGGWLRWRKP